MTLEDKILKLNGYGSGKWAERILGEIAYASAVSAANEHSYDALVEGAVDSLIESANADGGVITQSVAQATEQMLMPIASLAKSYKVHCISHAHIDMNWMWGFQETAAVTIDTFRTVLDLMKEYPELTFGQSQASTYQILEEYAPEMLEEIKERIREGRWEVTATTWVETDKNMPNGESLARHILYSKRYLSKLLCIPAESLNLDFEPDTFGHNISVPEICAKGGIKYYYHCRGKKTEEFIYRWRSRSGLELLVWREPEWYNYDIKPEMFRKVPQLCAKYSIKSFLSVYGVGDHGGGPTRRDVQRLMDISTWPIMPTVVFSTYGAFFEEIEKYRENFPIMEGESNYIFTGCYTSQSRIKMANRIAEDRMYESEMISAAANVMAGGKSCSESYGKAWEKILFNHFHDILPGTGVVDTREHALGQFQLAMATVQTNANRSMREIAAAIDTSSIKVEEIDETVSEGAAVGFGTDEISRYKMPSCERGCGKKRIFHLFNSNMYDFDGVTDITVWDWNYSASHAVFTDANGEVTVNKCVADNKTYWSHQYKTFAVRVKVPAMGYATYVLDLKDAAEYKASTFQPGHVYYEYYDDSNIVMENDKICAVFDHKTMQLLSLVDKKTGENMINAPSATFRLIQENLVHGMSAWRVGDAMRIENINETRNVVVNEVNLGSVRKVIKYAVSFGQRSKLNVSVILNDSSSVLDFDINVNFQESPDYEKVPQLNFIVPVGYAVSNYRYDVPFGTIDREEIKQDVPANSFAVAIRNEKEKPAVMLVSDSKYGYRGADNAVAVSLIRATNYPDTFPEHGKHNIRLGVGVLENSDNTTLYRMATEFIHPIASCSARAGEGSLPLNGQLMKVEGKVQITAVKTAEDIDGLIVRLSDVNGLNGRFKLTFLKDVKSASETDLNENIIDEVSFNDNEVTTDIKPWEIKTILIRF
ncbi:MAG: alpha-mannosidase [Ruminococcaceae bacterium]|nr:alpha-mannosidase [Oscillospiraceae bacterium]